MANMTSTSPSAGAALEQLKEELDAQIDRGFQRRDPAHVHVVFAKHAKAGDRLTREQLLSCLAELGLPLAVTDDKFDAIDADGDGMVSLGELGKFLEMATPLQRWAASLRLAELVADALPVKNHEAPLEELSQLDEARIRVICERLAGSLERAMKEQVALLQKSLEAQKAAAQQAASGAAAKFEVVAMSAGSTKDFYEGLEGRVGEWQQPCALACLAPCLHSSCPAV